MTTALTAMVLENERQAQEIRRLWQALAEVAETVESPDGHVVVTVDARGRIRGLQLDPRIYYSDPSSLAVAILDTLAEAALQARHRTTDLLRPLVPAHMDVADADLAFDPVLAELDRLRR